VGQRATRTTLIQSVAEAYFELRGLDALMVITENTIKARQESLKLTQALEAHGAGSLADVRQAEELLHAAQANLPDLRRQIAIQENTISVLLGHNPGAIDRGLSVEEQPHPSRFPSRPLGTTRKASGCANRLRQNSLPPTRASEWPGRSTSRRYRSPV